MILFLSKEFIKVCFVMKEYNFRKCFSVRILMNIFWKFYGKYKLIFLNGNYVFLIIFII